MTIAHVTTKQPRGTSGCPWPTHERLRNRALLSCYGLEPGRSGGDVHGDVVRILLGGKWLGISCGRVQGHVRRKRKLEVQVDVGNIAANRILVAWCIAFLAAEEGWNGKMGIELRVAEERHSELAVKESFLKVRRVSLLFLGWSLWYFFFFFYKKSTSEVCRHEAQCTESCTTEKNVKEDVFESWLKSWLVWE